MLATVIDERYGLTRDLEANGGSHRWMSPAGLRFPPGREGHGAASAACRIMQWRTAPCQFDVANALGARPRRPGLRPSRRHPLVRNGCGQHRCRVVRQPRLRRRSTAGAFGGSEAAGRNAPIARRMLAIGCRRRSLSSAGVIGVSGRRGGNGDALRFGDGQRGSSATHPQAASRW